MRARNGHADTDTLVMGPSSNPGPDYYLELISGPSYHSFPLNTGRQV